VSTTEGPADPYSRVQYRRLVAWGARIEREGPFLLEILDAAPDRSVIDFGCGTGEHVAFLAEQGAHAVGLDASASMLEAATDHERGGLGRFVEGDLREADRVLAGEPAFGAGLCLGNVLPHLLEDDDLAAFARAAHAVLRPGGALLLQILNYVRIREAGLRHLPVNVRPGDADQEIVFLRLLRVLDEDRILFFPTTLELDADAENPVRLERSKKVVLRTWTREALEGAFAAAGFDVTAHGDMQGGPFLPLESADLVLIARR